MPGQCVCTKCGFRMKAPVGSDCHAVRCPRCGSSMSESGNLRINTVDR